MTLSPESHGASPAGGRFWLLVAMREGAGRCAWGSLRPQRAMLPVGPESPSPRRRGRLGECGPCEAGGEGPMGHNETGAGGENGKVENFSK